jgi:hypothetical protein
MLEIFSATVWTFLSVAVLAALVVPTAWLENVIEVGVRVVGATPVPLTLTDASTLFDELLMLTEPEAAPRTLGAKDTLILHVAPAAILPAQVSLSVKYCGAAIVTSWADVPVFLSVTVFAALVLPSATFPNVSVDGVAVICADKLALALSKRRTIVSIQKILEIDADLRPTTAEARIETPEIVVRVLLFSGGIFLLGGGGFCWGNYTNY